MTERCTSADVLAKVKKAHGYAPVFSEVESEAFPPGGSVEPYVFVLASPSIYKGKRGRVVCERRFVGRKCDEQDGYSADLLVKFDTPDGFVRAGFTHEEVREAV